MSAHTAVDDQIVNRRHVIRFKWLIQGELPFTVNVPTGTYPVDVAGASYPLELLQERIGVAVGANAMMIDTAAKIRLELGERWESTYKHELRTVVRHTDEATVTPDHLVKPTDEDLFAAMQTGILRDHRGYPGDKHQLQADARASLAAMSEEVRQAFVEDTTVRMTAHRLFPNGDVKTFCKAVNALIRLYMTTFGDYFVEEVCRKHFANTAFRGLSVSCTTTASTSRTTAMREAAPRSSCTGHWFHHPGTGQQRFRDRLQHAVEPDPVALLGTRPCVPDAGAYRSAINEASAALDLSVTRKITPVWPHRASRKRKSTQS